MDVRPPRRLIRRLSVASVVIREVIHTDAVIAVEVRTPMRPSRRGVGGA
ncbi:Uncharacterised protein [Mycobacteroides abscessus subsp. abscessus]|nr:Uncharacterised protein [Mycobacteroides abscessus subsp. abscessus]